MGQGGFKMGQEVSELMLRAERAQLGVCMD